MSGARATPGLVEVSEGRIRSLLRGTLFHAYEYRGKSYLLDPVLGLLFRLSPRHLELARLLSKGAAYSVISDCIASVGAQTAAQLLDDIENLKREGLFDRSSLSLTEIHRKAVGRFMAHAPRKMMLLVSQTCNLRCVYCYAIEGNFADTGRKMTLDTAQQAIRFLARRAGRRRSLTVTLFGGEPLTNFSMIQQLVPWSRTWTKSIGKRIHFCITTNGTLLNKESIQFLIDERFSILISLDGPKAVQNTNRPDTKGRGSFDRAAAGIRRLLEAHPHPEIVKVRATMTHQYHDLREISEFFKELGFQRIGLGANVGFAYGKGPFDLRDEDRKEIFAAAEGMLDEFALDAIREYRYEAYNPVVDSLVAIHDMRAETGPRVKIPCGVGRNDQGVDVDGNIYPCHRYVGMAEFVVGNVESGIDQAKLRQYYERILHAHTHCESCWATHWCSGQCSQYLCHASGNVYPPDRGSCDSIRRNLERNVALYNELNDEGLEWERVRAITGG